MWIDSSTSYLWHYEGSLDAAGKVLTLEATGPAPGDATRKAHYRDSIEFQGPDRRIWTSTMQADDGSWTTLATTESTRKKS